MTAYESLEISYPAEHIGHILLTGPGKGNAMGTAMWREIPLAVAELDANLDVRAIVLSGSEKNFTFGLDIMDPPKMIMGAASGDAAAAGLAAERSALLELIRDMQQAANSLERANTPVIAAVHGWCIGGGVDLVSAADIRIADATAKFSVREIRLGIVADMGSLARLPHIIGDAATRELALTGRDFDAEEALRLGLVSRTIAVSKPEEPGTEVLAAAMDLAAEIAAQPPLVARGVKDVLNHVRQPSVDASNSYVAVWNSAFLPSEDLHEALMALAMRRAPEFKGR